jgi:hypothetical protein
MKQKIILSLLFIVVLSLATFVSATINTIDDSGNVIKYSTQVQLYKGWNLIPATCNSGIPELQNANIKTLYAYSPKQNKYVLTYHDGEFKEEGLNDMGITETYLCSMSWWAYATEQTSYTYETDYILKMADFDMEAGWNFLIISPEVVGNSLEDIKGDCEIEKAYFYNAEENEVENWKNLPLAYNIPDYVGGLGMIVKVTDYCNLGTSATGGDTQPPTIPN